jgi:cytochrome c peroxidase
MHDGRFGTLEAVLNHYSNGDSPTLDPILNKTDS